MSKKLYLWDRTIIEVPDVNGFAWGCGRYNELDGQGIIAAHGNENGLNFSIYSGGVWTVLGPILAMPVNDRIHTICAFSHRGNKAVFVTEQGAMYTIDFTASSYTVSVTTRRVYCYRYEGTELYWDSFLSPWFSHMVLTNITQRFLREVSPTDYSSVLAETTTPTWDRVICADFDDDDNIVTATLTYNGWPRLMQQGGSLSGTDGVWRPIFTYCDFDGALQRSQLGWLRQNSPFIRCNSNYLIEATDRLSEPDIDITLSFSKFPSMVVEYLFDHYPLSLNPITETYLNVLVMRSRAIKYIDPRYGDLVMNEIEVSLDGVGTQPPNPQGGRSTIIRRNKVWINTELQNHLRYNPYAIDHLPWQV